MVLRVKGFNSRVRYIFTSYYDVRGLGEAAFPQPFHKASLDIRKRLFTEGVVSHWNRLSRVATAPNLSAFKEHLDDALSQVI